MILSDLETKKIAIWGLGAEGLESFRFLRRHFPDKHLLLINQDRPDDLPDDDHFSFVLEEDLEPQIKNIDVVIKAPGISLYHPLVTKLKRQGITLTSATNIWFAQPRGGKVIAVTGSNGKSTTCALLNHILNSLGFKTALGGNIGTTLLSLPNNAQFYVVELSSYQTADFCYDPDIVILLNLFPEHIQWHLSHEQYFKDKSNLIRTGSETIILNRTDPLTIEQISQIPEGTLWFNDIAGIHANDDSIMSGSIVLGSCADIALPGGHNLENICAALTVCRALGLDLKACFKLAASYQGLPHRLENLGKVGGFTFINDSISTTPEATLAALKSFAGQDITLLIGGQDRQQDYAQLAQYIKSHPEITMIAAYETGPKISRALGSISFVKGVNDLGEAVALAQKITPKDGIILLSPAAPSYDAFLNFEDRGRKFKALI